MEILKDLPYILALVVSLFIVGVAVIIGVINFINKPNSEKIISVKEWLKYAVLVAEKKYGSGTGQLKLRHVYDMFTLAFPAVCDYISFSTFSEWVDEALTWLNTQLNSNTSIKNYVKGSDVSE